MDIERAAALGFGKVDTTEALAIIEAMGAPSATLDVAMDLSRFVMIPLPDATRAVFSPRILRRLGLSPDTFREDCMGMASAYAKTFHGSLAVLKARGYTFS